MACVGLSRPLSPQRSLRPQTSIASSRSIFADVHVFFFFSPVAYAAFLFTLNFYFYKRESDFVIARASRCVPVLRPVISTINNYYCALYMCVADVSARARVYYIIASRSGDPQHGTGERTLNDLQKFRITAMVYIYIFLSTRIWKRKALSIRAPRKEAHNRSLGSNWTLRMKEGTR